MYKASSVNVVTSILDRWKVCFN